MPYLVVTSSGRQIHSVEYWNKGYYDEPTLIHFGTLNTVNEKLVNALKARPITPYPKELCLHWISNVEFGSVLDTLETHGYNLVSSHENDGRVSYTFKANK